MKPKMLIAALFVGSHAQANQWQGKASQALLDQLTQSTQVEMLVTFHNPQPTSQKLPSGSPLQRRQSHINHLKSMTSQAQQAVAAYLQRHDIKHRSFWINNSILVTVDEQQMAHILSRDEVKSAHSNLPQQLTIPDTSAPARAGFNGIEWNVSMVNAPQVWSQGHTGQGIVLGGQDTGYQWDHPVIRDQYRGWNGQSADHNYNWHDAISNPVVPCGSAPCDDHSHGSHTMGTMVGDDGNSNQVGVAPGARWIGCRNMDQGNGTPATYTACFQWFMEPTDLNGENPDASQAPHIINNSWGCPGFEGCTDPNVMLTTVQNVVDAGILVVVAAGNDGASCQTINTPAAIYQPSLTVGSTTSADIISGFSSRGQVTADGSNRIKPDVSAPGSSVRSANNSGGYSTFSGTSMAAPNVAGVAALVMSANPGMIGQPRMMKHVLTQSAVAKTTNQSCGGVSGTSIPNNTYGHGRLDALSAVNYAVDLVYYHDFNE
jgi:subtilisin family serine protease